MRETIKKAVLMNRVSDTKFSKLSKWRALRLHFKKIDMFGTQINFTHKYKDTFKTMEGAVLTLLIFMALAIIAGIYLYNMVTRNE
jgi:hypothetical protein